ncbi:MBL fold metallo-hydrolase [Paenibacillus taichungensis]|uniref:MBL fold metallo-hydrolase n=1 Tax=Paenibacillus taichungensis TaxID=484184 RepID=UPI0028729493|nr:MBL fold metallo-hydrolase [Paenibacillus taichungensis]MDR9745759.1 MBL fold metallo-hydrolase [Paenibacillus taichungensis]
MIRGIEAFTGSRHFRLNEVAEGVFAAIAVPGTGSLGNATIVDLGDATLVVDTFTTVQAAEDLQTAAEYLTGRKASYVINTHWHSDHTCGNQVFVPAAQIISTSITREIMDTFVRNRITQQLAKPEAIYDAIDELDEQIQRETNEKLRQEMQWDNASDREYMKMLPDLVYSLPNLTFDQHMTIHGSKRSVELITFGGGHTQSDALVFIPKDRIAIMGDLVLSKHHPVLMYANPQQWLDILNKVEQLDIEIIVPGHGEVCSLNALHEVKAYITDLLEIVTDAAQRNENLDEITVPSAYQDWFFTTYFKSNVQSIYEWIEKSGKSRTDQRQPND